MKIGVAWFRTERDYHSLVPQFQDGAAFPSAYDDWVKMAVEDEDRLFMAGLQPVRVPLDPYLFPGWCAARALAMNAHARALFCTKKCGEESLLT